MFTEKCYKKFEYGLEFIKKINLLKFEGDMDEL